MALSREKILDTAFDLLRQYGLADLSMRRLATELEVAPGALYYHVKNKQELLASLASRMVENVQFAGGSPQKSLYAGCLQLYTEIAQVRESAEVIRLALALHPQDLSFMREAVTFFAEITECNDAELAAKTLLHVCISMVEEEQTRAMLASNLAPTRAPESYREAVQATISGWTQHFRTPPE